MTVPCCVVKSVTGDSPSLNRALSLVESLTAAGWLPSQSMHSRLAAALQFAPDGPTASAIAHILFKTQLSVVTKHPAVLQPRRPGHVWSSQCPVYRPMPLNYGAEAVVATLRIISTGGTAPMTSTDLQTMFSSSQLLHGVVLYGLEEVNINLGGSASKRRRSNAQLDNTKAKAAQAFASLRTEKWTPETGAVVVQNAASKGATKFTGALISDEAPPSELATDSGTVVVGELWSGAAWKPGFLFEPPPAVLTAIGVLNYPPAVLVRNHALHLTWIAGLVVEELAHHGTQNATDTWLGRMVVDRTSCDKVISEAMAAFNACEVARRGVKAETKTMTDGDDGDEEDEEAPAWLSISSQTTVGVLEDAIGVLSHWTLERGNAQEAVLILLSGLALAASQTTGADIDQALRTGLRMMANRTVKLAFLASLPHGPTVANLIDEELHSLMTPSPALQPHGELGALDDDMTRAPVSLFKFACFYRHLMPVPPGLGSADKAKKQFVADAEYFSALLLILGSMYVSAVHDNGSSREVPAVVPQSSMRGDMGAAGGPARWAWARWLFRKAQTATSRSATVTREWALDGSTETVLLSDLADWFQGDHAAAALEARGTESKKLGDIKVSKKTRANFKSLGMMFAAFVPRKPIETTVLD